jgi:ADP-ribose pyrophosphatase
MHEPDRIVLGEGRFLRLVKERGWEFVERTNVTGIAVIVAVTADGRLLLTEQLRRPLNKLVIELPAGLAGDVAGEEDELLAIAAGRELLEETGYQAERMEYLAAGTTSAGLCTEIVTVFRAQGLKKVAAGGGVDHENIRVHEVPLDSLDGWLRQQEIAGKLVDLKVYAATSWAAVRPSNS